jgi:hypothetical protein
MIKNKRSLQFGHIFLAFRKALKIKYFGNFCKVYQENKKKILECFKIMKKFD